MIPPHFIRTRIARICTNRHNGSSFIRVDSGDSCSFLRAGGTIADNHIFFCATTKITKKNRKHRPSGKFNEWERIELFSTTDYTEYTDFFFAYE